MDSDSSTTSDSDDELPSWVAHVLLLLVEDQQQGPAPTITWPDFRD